MMSGEMCFHKGAFLKSRNQLIVLFSLVLALLCITPEIVQAELHELFAKTYGNDLISLAGQSGDGIELQALLKDRDAGGLPGTGRATSLSPPGQDGLFGRYSVLVEDTLYLVVPAVAVMGVLWASPDNFSNWSDDDKARSFDDLLDKWKENVIDEGPHWDSDDMLLNVVAHPYCGSAYYIHARHYGYSQVESLIYSFVVSTFFYEYGIEAFAENPSIQDILITPLGGFLLAELLLPLEKQIIENNKKVLDSRILGALSLFFIDPIGHIVGPLKELTDYLFADDIDVRISPIIKHFAVEDNVNHESSSEYQYGLMLTFRW